MPMPTVPDKLLGNARELRRNQTDVEKKLWYILRDRRLMKYKFVRQKVIGSYIVDFVCREYKLIVELDGGQHAEQLHYDEKRDSYLTAAGYKVLRFWNDEVIENSEGVLEKVATMLSTLTPTLSRQRERENME